MAPKTVITFGTYDLFHYGHLRIVQRAAEQGERLVVGVSSDALNWKKKQQKPAVPEAERMAIVRALDCVDEVFLEESLDLKKEYVLRYGADVLVMGDDHLNEYNDMLEGICDCVYLPRTRSVSTTQLKREISSSALAALEKDTAGQASRDSGQPGSPGRSSPTLTQRPSAAAAAAEKAQSDAHSAAGKNLVHATEQSNAVMAFLVEAHDAYYDWVMRACTPFCAAMPRDVTVGGTTFTVFTANIVTYFRGFLSIPIALGMRYGYLGTAAFLVMFHDFLDHLDGVVAKQQARDGRSKGDNGAFGAFIDAQMDKLVFCLCLWSFSLLVDHQWDYSCVTALLTCAVLFALEATIACVRTTDYFRATLCPAPAGKGKPALRAVSEGKLKQKFESIGVSAYCLALPCPAATPIATGVGTVCLGIAAYFATQSLSHKLRARAALKTPVANA